MGWEWGDITDNTVNGDKVHITQEDIRNWLIWECGNSGSKKIGQGEF